MKLNRSTLCLLGALSMTSLPQAGFAQSGAQTHVCMETSLGNICMALLSDAAPQTVANFLNYVNDGDYDGTFIHRVVNNFVVQGGGYYYSNPDDEAVAVESDDPVVNEFGTSNLRGTVAMAKLPNDPNSATNEFFFNLKDNSADLDGQNGGFTVFAEVVGNGMEIVDAIATRTRQDLSFVLGNPFSDVPLLKLDNNLSDDDFVTLNRVFATDADNLLPETEPPVATGIYTGLRLTLPVRYRGNIFQLIFDNDGTALDGDAEERDFMFTPRLGSIVQHNDIGQLTGHIDGLMMTVPSIIYGTDVYTNLVFLRESERTLEFELMSFDLPGEDGEGGE